MGLIHKIWNDITQRLSKLQVNFTFIALVLVQVSEGLQDVNVHVAHTLQVWVQDAPSFNIMGTMCTCTCHLLITCYIHDMNECTLLCIWLWTLRSIFHHASLQVNSLKEDMLPYSHKFSDRADHPNQARGNYNFEWLDLTKDQACNHLITDVVIRLNNLTFKHSQIYRKTDIIRHFKDKHVFGCFFFYFKKSLFWYIYIVTVKYM